LTVPAHQQAFTHHYVVRYPEHDPRAKDPHRHDFLEWKRRRREAGTWYCDFAMEHRSGDTSECDTVHPLEAHHKLIELATMNEVDFALLEADFPGISAQEVGAWINGDQNLTLLCVAHHRGPGGVHTASFSDFGSEFYVRDLISKGTPP
jgi:hypothetical protein